MMLKRKFSLKRASKLLVMARMEEHRRKTTRKEVVKQT